MIQRLSSTTVHRPCRASLARVVFLFLFLLSLSSLRALEIGANRTDLLREKGAPTTIIEGNGRSILTFSDHSIVTLVDDKVAEISQEPVVPLASQKSAAPTIPKLSVDRRTAFVAIGVSFLAALVVFRIFFSGLNDFIECVRFFLQPNWISAFRGEWAEDSWATAKLFVWFAFSAIPGIFYYGYCGGTIATAKQLFSR